MKKIILIEDDLGLGENLKEFLTEEGFQVLHASEGLKGIELIKSEMPDLIISDVVLPDTNGLEIKAELNDDILVSTIPFIFLSAKSDQKDIRKGMELGADDYLIKPFTFEELLKSINSRLIKSGIFKKNNKELTKSIALSLPHEFNNPLISVLGYSEIIIDSFDKGAQLTDAEIIKYAKSIYNAGKELHGLLKRFLLITKLETIFSDSEEIKKYNESRTNFVSTADIKNNIVQLSYEKYENQIILQENLEELILDISFEDISIIYSELISNAYKFKTPNSEIFVSESIEDKFYCLQIKNYGRGLTKEQIAQIGLFQQFERERYEQRGSGIGLSIAKKLTELNKGYLRIESLLKAETIVYLYLPIKDK